MSSPCSRPRSIACRPRTDARFRGAPRPGEKSTASPAKSTAFPLPFGSSAAKDLGCSRRPRNDWKTAQHRRRGATHGPPVSRRRFERQRLRLRPGRFGFSIRPLSIASRTTPCSARSCLAGPPTGSELAPPGWADRVKSQTRSPSLAVTRRFSSGSTTGSLPSSYRAVGVDAPQYVCVPVLAHALVRR